MNIVTSKHQTQNKEMWKPLSSWGIPGFFISDNPESMQLDF